MFLLVETLFDLGVALGVFKEKMRVFMVRVLVKLYNVLKIVVTNVLMPRRS